MKTLTMVGRAGNDIKSYIATYMFLDENYKVVTLGTAELIKYFRNSHKDTVITNLEYDCEKKELVSTNGAMQNYTYFNNEKNGYEVEKVVILNRVEKNSKLVGYTAFSMNKGITEISVSTAVLLCDKKAISNGKIRHTENGDIVSSINGNYPLREIAIEDAPESKVEIKVMYFGKTKARGRVKNYAGILLMSDSVSTIAKYSKGLTSVNQRVISEYKELTGENAEELKVQSNLNCNINEKKVFIYSVVDISTLAKLAEKCKMSFVGRVSIVNFDRDKDETVLYFNNWQVENIDGEDRNEIESYFKELRTTFQK